MPGARITAELGSLRLETQTGADGVYVLRTTSGNSVVQVSRIGFEPLTREMRLDAAQGDTRTEDFTLLVAHAVATVSVTASEGYVAETSAAATKSDAPLLDTPQAISVITSEQLKQRGVQTLNEALRYTPGVAVETWGRGSAL